LPKPAQGLNTYYNNNNNNNIVPFILCIFSASFDVADLHIHAWFRIKVNLDMWEDITPADVFVETVIGSVK